jgi:hypothetical protein
LQNRERAIKQIQFANGSSLSTMSVPATVASQVFETGCRRMFFRTGIGNAEPSFVPALATLGRILD